MTYAGDRHITLRRMLTTRRQELEHDVKERIRDGRATRPAEGRDLLENSEADTQAEIAFSLLQMETETLAQIDTALGRLDVGKYGTCFECDGEIAEPRLRALPFAVRCRSCEERNERGRKPTVHPFQAPGSAFQLQTDPRS